MEASSRFPQSRQTSLRSKAGLFLLLVGLLLLAFSFIRSQNHAYLFLESKGDWRGELFLFEIDPEGSFHHVPSSFQALSTHPHPKKTAIFRLSRLESGQFRLQFRTDTTSIPAGSSDSPTFLLENMTLRQGALTALHTPVEFQVRHQHLTTLQNRSPLELKVHSLGATDFPYLDIGISRDCIDAATHLHSLTLLLDAVIVLIPFCIAVFLAGLIWRTKGRSDE